MKDLRVKFKPAAYKIGSDALYSARAKNFQTRLRVIQLQSEQQPSQRVLNPSKNLFSSASFNRPKKNSPTPLASPPSPPGEQPKQAIPNPLKNLFKPPSLHRPKKPPFPAP